MVLRLEAFLEKLEEYKRYHAAVWRGVLERITASQITNYSIFHRDSWLFSYFEYWGDDFEADMKLMAADLETRRQWAMMEPTCRIPSPTGLPVNGGRAWRRCFTTTDREVPGLKTCTQEAGSAALDTGRFVATISPFLETFGPSRLLFVSDWPVVKPFQIPYTPWLKMARTLLEIRPADKQAAAFNDNAGRIPLLGPI